MRTIAFCEIEPYCRAVLRKHWPDIPIHDDIRTLDAATIHRYANGQGQSDGSVDAKAPGLSRIDLISGGFPCQPFSHAGKRRGAEDDRHLWPQMARVISEVRPTWVVGENVAGLVKLGLDLVLSDLEGMGYAVQTFCIPACAVDAPHRRDRLWIVAHTDRTSGARQRQHGGPVLSDEASARPRGICDASDPDKPRLEVQFDGQAGERAAALGGGWRWPAESGLGRVAHGVPRRVDRLRALGNAVVPQIPELIGRAIIAAEEAND